MDAQGADTTSAPLWAGWCPGRLELFCRPGYVLHVSVVFVTDVFHQFFAGPQACGERDLERPGVGTRIIDRRFDHERSHVGARVPFDRVKLFGVRRSLKVEPELVVEADAIDDERIAFPVAD